MVGKQIERNKKIEFPSTFFNGNLFSLNKLPLTPKPNMSCSMPRREQLWALLNLETNAQNMTSREAHYVSSLAPGKKCLSPSFAFPKYQGSSSYRFHRYFGFSKIPENFGE